MKIDISKASVDIKPLQGEVASALEKLDKGNGAGSDFIGWHHLPGSGGLCRAWCQRFW